MALVAPAHAEPFTPPPEPAPQWLFYVALRNDAFTQLEFPVDDFGFTHDNVVTLRYQDGDYAYGGGIIDRWITSTMDYRRWDQLEVFAIGERIWIAPLAIDVPHELLVTARAGPSFGGNFGGRYLQNGWHALTNSGATVGNGLAYIYDGDTRVGFTTGGRARASIGDRFQAYSYLDGQLALGATGVTSGQAALGGSINIWYLGAYAELAGSRYHTNDPNLKLPGAYRPGWQLEWRVGIRVRWSRFHIGYEYRANESGSGEPIGVLEFQSRRF